MAACLCAAAFAGPAFAQSGPRIGVDSVRVSQRGGDVDVAMRLDVPRGTVKQNYSLFYTPVRSTPRRLPRSFGAARG